MVYNRARLEHALKVFRESASWRDKRGLPSENLERHLLGKYDFRRTSKSTPLVNISIWHNDGKHEGSDDEEYDPRKERKRLNGRKKKSDQKRRAEDFGDQERVVKKLKGEKSSFASSSSLGYDGAYITLRLTSQKAKLLLTDLSHVHRTGLVSFKEKENLDGESNYWRHSGNRAGTAGKRYELDWLSDENLLTDVGCDKGRDASASYELTTSLRSGKVLQKKSRSKNIDANTNGSTKQDANVAKHDNNQATPKPHILAEPITRPGIVNCRSSYQIHSNRRGSTYDEPIELDSSDEQIDAPCSDIERQHVTLKRKGMVRHHISNNVKREASSSTPPALSFEPFHWVEAPRHAESFQNEPGIFVIETHYAHPIDFKYNPLRSEECGFCTDHRTGILGYPKRLVSVFVNPDNTSQFIEVENGYRSMGKPSTKMCISCALDRLLMARCHCTEDKSTASVLTTDGLDAVVHGHSFSRISISRPSQDELDAYLFALSSRQEQGSSNRTGSLTPTRHGPIPTCNLCLAPASWQCSKWQKTDKTKKPCRVPELDTPNPTLVSSSSTSSSPAIPRIEKLASPSSSQSTRLSSACCTGNFLRSSPALSTHPSSEPPTCRAQPAFSNSSRTSTHTPPSTVSTTSSPKSSLRPPLRGCGLKLCASCKNFVLTQCNGTLDRKKILKRMRDSKQNRLGIRADIEWLFEGSALWRAYA